MAGFNHVYNLNGGETKFGVFYMKDTETLTKGDIVNLESGEVDLAVTSDALLVGAVVGVYSPLEDEASSGVITGEDSVTRVVVILNPDAVYETDDDNARNAGDTLDISGTTGAQGVATSSNTEFVIVETKLNTTDKTRVMITPSAHYAMKS